MKEQSNKQVVPILLKEFKLRLKKSPLSDDLKREVMYRVKEVLLDVEDQYNKYLATIIRNRTNPEQALVNQKPTQGRKM